MVIKTCSTTEVIDLFLWFVAVNKNMGDIIQNNVFLVIPSWQKLLDFPTLGRYIDDSQVVSNIFSDPIIFFGGLESTKKVGDQFLHFIFGVGLYFTKF